MMATTAPCNSVGLVFKTKEYYTFMTLVVGVFTFLLLYLHMYYSHWNVFYKQQYSMVTPVIQSYSPCFTFLFFLLAHLTQRVM
jgi:succinate dehydrogenase/fumarate reductase cytochrome b subunit